MLAVVLWLDHLIVWTLGVKQPAVIQLVELMSWKYFELDIFVRYVFAFLLLRWVADDERIVATSRSGTDCSSVPADDQR